MSGAGARVSVVGATGTLGSQVLTALSSSPLRVLEGFPVGLRPRGLTAPVEAGL